MRKIVIGLGLAAAAQLASAAPAIVGSWYASALTGYTGHALVTFLDDGHYILGEFDSTWPSNAGIEWGTYNWNAGTGELTTTQIGDTNGDWGFSHPDGTLTVTINGDTATLLELDDLSSAVTAQRVGFAPGTILGTWYDPVTVADGAPSQFTFLPSGVVIEIEGGEPTFDPVTGQAILGQPGLAIGSYSWNATTGRVTFSSVVVDTTITSDGVRFSSVFPQAQLIVLPNAQGGVDLVGTNMTVPYTAAVPEVSSLLMLGMGLGVVAGLRRRTAA